MNWYAKINKLFRFAALPPKLKNNGDWIRRFPVMVQDTLELSVPMSPKIVSDSNVHYITDSAHNKYFGKVNFQLTARNRLYEVAMGCRDRTYSHPQNGKTFTCEWTVSVYRQENDRDWSPVGDVEELWDVGPYEAVQKAIEIVQGDNNDGEGSDTPVDDPSPSTSTPSPLQPMTV